MTPEAWALVGAIAGTAVGVLGGIVGTYLSIKNTRGSRERALAVRASLLCWALVIAFGVGMWLIPHPQRHWLWLPYAILLTVGIVAWNRRWLQIRHQESNRSA
jgi:MFS family permease